MFVVWPTIFEGVTSETVKADWTAAPLATADIGACTQLTSDLANLHKGTIRRNASPISLAAPLTTTLQSQSISTLSHADHANREKDALSVSAPG
ncbi:hypothetical protein DV737_g3612, partial [Chaetothyriales sp. CBS 132003]